MSCRDADVCKKYRANIGNPYPHQNPCTNCQYDMSDYERGFEKGDKMTNEEFIKLLEDTQQEFEESDGGCTRFIFKDKTYETDTGYAIEGIRFFVERMKNKLLDH